MLDLNISFKGGFNPQPILSAAERMQARVLTQFGAYVMRTAANSIKDAGASKARAVSQPGQPPRGHHGTLQLKKLIRFAYEPSERAVYIGPIKANGTNLTSPAIIEFGGDEEIQYVTVGGKKGPAGKLRPRTGKVTVHYEPRPFMRPAFDKAIKKFLPELLKNGIMKEV